MTELSIQFDDLSPLLAALCDGTIDGNDFARLDRLLATDPAARQWYMAYMDLHGELVWDHRKNDECGMMNDELLAHPSSFIIHPSPPIHYPLSATNSFVGSLLFSYLVATVIMGVGLLIGWMWKVSDYRQLAQTSSPPASAGKREREFKVEYVGRITGMVDCQWERGSGLGFQGSGLPSPAGRGAGGEGGSDGLHPSSFIPHPSSLVSLGDKFALASGLMEITYDTGAKVILQGPVTYEVESKAGGYLSIGKLTARVEKKAEGGRRKAEEASDPNSPFPLPPSPFVVRTPIAAITDLGTEFGVEVDKTGATQPHVFRGSVRVQVVAPGGHADGVGRVLHENESARVHTSNGHRTIVLTQSSKPTAFVRELPELSIKTFDLVDVVAGGDGFSGRRNRGIDPRNGRVSDAIRGEYHLVGDGKYHRVEGMPFVDGVFIPYSGGGPVQLDSAGHVFAEFPATENRTGGLVFGGKEGDNGSELGGVEYNSPGHGLIAMHANKGVTFDLEAIRRENPGWKLLRFRAVTGNTELASEKGLAVWADVWVFVDGQVRFRRREINRYNGAMPVVVPINDNERFLTLVATDGGNSISWDHIMFGDPRLELVSAEAVASPTPPGEAAEH